MSERKEELKQQAKYFFDSKSKVHIEKYGRRWYNGVIVSFDDKKIMFQDRKLSVPIPIFYSDIKYLEPFTEGGKYGN